MNPGELKQRLIFQTLGGIDDEGFPTDEPVVYTKAWGKLKTYKGRTRILAAQAQMEHNREFTIRYQKKLDDNERPPGLVATWKGKEHDVDSIENDDGLNKTMTVILKARSPS
jgi:SPP1 family predicted phage head-tail adaptor